jgi:hypothetical protein
VDVDQDGDGDLAVADHETSLLTLLLHDADAGRSLPHLISAESATVSRPPAKESAR